jgi:hypothetical protein
MYGNNLEGKIEHYTPSEFDLRWTRELLRTTHDNAIWSWPDAGLIMQLRHSEKTLAVVEMIDLGGDPQEAARIAANATTMLRDVFNALGWRVVMDFKSGG